MSKFYRSIIAAGFGGQGVLSLGQLVAYTAMNEGRYVTWIPSYGPEMRGGTANCSVITSEEEIASPVVSKPDIVVIMNQPSLDKFEPCLKEGGLLVYNSDLVTYDNPRKDVRVLPIAANSAAMELGNVRVANVIVLGALAENSDLVDLEVCKKTIAEVFGKKKAKLVDLNLQAFEKGRELGKG